MEQGIRVLVAAPTAHMRELASHVKGLTAEGLTVLYVTADRPYAALIDAFKEAGADSGKLAFIDAISYMDGNRPGTPPERTLFLQSPTMLEMMAMRVEQMIAQLPGPVHVVVDSLSTLALYNGVPPVQEFSHYLANRLRTHRVPGDLVVRDNDTGRDLLDRVVGFTDDQIRLGGGN